ncbi:MAG TPA: DUF4911 domain-containing protein [Patescibacteria group bacterium]|nr:DUF4911 domain-containing protein [Patescibacteria group bacterium]
MKTNSNRSFVSTPDDIYLQTHPSQINFINRIMEGYEYLGVLTTLSKTEGILVVRATPDTRADVLQILDHLPLEIVYIEKPVIFDGN